MNKQIWQVLKENDIIAARMILYSKYMRISIQHLRHESRALLSQLTMKQVQFILESGEFRLIFRIKEVLNL